MAVDEEVTWETLKDKGNVAFRNNALDDAISLYSEAIEMKGDEPALFSNRSAAYLKQRNFEEAAHDATKAIAIDGTFVKAYSRLFTALCGLGRFHDAIRELNNGVELLSAADPAADVQQLVQLRTEAEKAKGSLQQAEELLNQGRSADAERVLGPTYSSFPDSAPVAFLFSEARAVRAPDEVTRSLMLFSLTHDSDPQYLYVRALALYYRGQDGFKNAQLLLRQALEYDPDNKKASVLLKKIRLLDTKKEEGNAAFKAKKHKEACDLYTTAIEVDSSNTRLNAILRGNRAAARMELKDFKGALLDCDFAINNGTGSAKMHARRSRIQEHLENWDAALQDMQQAASEGDGSYNAELRQLQVRVKRAKRKDYYKILGISQREADENSIKQAYKKACLQWHPDKWAHASDEEKETAETNFKEVGEAFAVLSDPRKKSMYDNGQLDNDVEGGGGPQGYAQSNEELMAMMNMMFGGNFGRQGFQQQRGARPQGFSAGVF